jgi:hypothetical protein
MLQTQNLGMELSWSQADELNTARNSLGGAGTQTSALAFGGVAPQDL